MLKYAFVISMLLMLVIKTPVWVNMMTVLSVVLLVYFLIVDLVIKPLWRKRQRRLAAEANAKAMKDAFRN